jgi:hypothetical protein
VKAVWNHVIPIIGREVLARWGSIPPVSREAFVTVGRDLLRYAGRDLLAFVAGLVTAL